MGATPKGDKEQKDKDEGADADDEEVGDVRKRRQGFLLPGQR